jgi:hypothetical protein
LREQRGEIFTRSGFADDEKDAGTHCVWWRLIQQTRRMGFAIGESIQACESDSLLGNLACLALKGAGCGDPGWFFHHARQAGPVKARNGIDFASIAPADGGVAHLPCMSDPLNRSFQFSSGSGF